MTEKEYQVTIVKSSKECKVTNVLEGTTYITKNDDIIIRGTMGEYWVETTSKIINKYRNTDGSPITRANFILGKVFKAKTTKGNHRYALRVPMQMQMSTTTAEGNVLKVNRTEVEHGEGDYLVCKETYSKPNFKDVWVVNGKVFETTYARVEKTKEEALIEINALEKNISDARNANLSRTIYLKEE